MKNMTLADVAQEALEFTFSKEVTAYRQFLESRTKIIDEKEVIVLIVLGDGDEEELQRLVDDVDKLRQRLGSAE